MWRAGWGLVVVALVSSLAGACGSDGAPGVADEPAPAAQSQPAAERDPGAGSDAPRLLSVGEKGTLGAFALRLQHVSLTTGEEAAVAAQVLLTNESGGDATTPTLVAVCETGAETVAKSQHPAGRVAPPGSLLTDEIRFELPADCGAVVVEARKGGERLGWRIEPPERVEAVSVAGQPEALLAVLETERRRYNITGMALAVASPELGVWSGGSGLADRDAGRSVEADDVFRIGDLTHMFIAATALQLVGEGALDLDAPLGAALPAVPKSDRMTLRQLLNHSSGINSFKSQAFAAAFFSDQRQEWEPAQVLAFLRPLNVDEPGAGWDHSTTNYLLVADVIEQATGTSIEDEVQRRFLDPLALTGTGWLERDDPPATLVSAFSKFGTRQIGPEWFTALETGFGTSWGMVSTAADLARWMRAIWGGDLLSEASLAVARDFIKGPGEIEAGLGIYAFENDYGPGLGYLSSGSGFLALAFYLPDQDVAVVVLANQTDTPTTKLTTAVLEVLLGAPPE